MNSVVEYWFSTPIWYCKIDSIDNKKISKYCISLAKKNKGRILSNFGGWQSDDIYVSSETNEELKKLQQFIYKELCSVAASMQIYDNLSIDEASLQFWININEYGNINLQHNHPQSFLSGVYYVKADEKSGKVRFEHPNSSIKFWYQLFTKCETHESFSFVEVTPEKGKLVIFPSWLEHSVTSNLSDKKRISIAFNAQLKNK